MTTTRAIPLTATVAGNKVKISGNGSANLAKDSGAHRFDFTVASPPGMTVQFQGLDTEDNAACPPSSGQNSDQIVGVTMNGATASFTDNNNNRGEMDVAYQWHFICSDTSKTVEPFDPVIKNGGTT